MWRFSYFAATNDMAVMNAQFSVGLSLTLEQEVFGAAQVYTADQSTLVNFADLLGVALTRRVAVEKYAEFVTAIQLVYNTFTDVTAPSCACRVRFRPNTRT